MTEDTTGTSETEWHAARDEALAVLRDALGWNLSLRRWEQVQDTVTEMAAAVAAASTNSLWQMTGRLELSSPVRVATRLGDAAVLPAPMLVRERIAELVDTLTRVDTLKAGDETGMDPAARS